MLDSDSKPSAIQLLAQYRQSIGLSHEDLAKEVGAIAGDIVADWEAGKHVILHAYLAPLCKIFHLGVSEEATFREAVSAQNDAIRAKKRYPKEKEYENSGTGALLRKYRRRAKIHLVELARELGITPAALNYWENGHSSIAPSKLSAIVRLLELNEQEAVELIESRLPAMNRDWLEEQLPAKRGGMLIQAHRLFNGYRGDKFQAMIECTTLPLWESAYQPVLETYIDPLVSKFHLEGEEAGYFCSVIAASNEAIRKDRPMNAASTNVGRVDKTTNLPDIDPDDLNKDEQNPRKR